MRCQIRVPLRVWQPTREWLLATRDERIAYLLARASVWDDPWCGPTVDLLVGCALLVPDAALTVQSAVRVEVDPAFTRAVLVGCYEAGLSLIDVHTHPFADTRVAFSGTDLANMATTHAEFHREIPQQPVAVAASLVLGRNAVAGAWLDPHRGRVVPAAGMLLLAPQPTEVQLCRP